MNPTEKREGKTMKKYIDRGAILRLQYSGGLEQDGIIYVPLREVYRGVREIPSADVVDVVRCKDCRYNTGDHKCLYPDSIIKVPDDNDFCSYGRRNDGDSSGDLH